jgi:hypothetical protein
MKPILLKLLFVLVVGMAYAANPPAPKPAAPVKPPIKKPVYELPKTGLNRQRPNGGWINAEIVGTQLVIKFFDKLKKPVLPDLERGFARFNYAAKNDKSAVLSRNGNILSTPATVRPPHNFLVILSLFAPGATEAAETYTFKYP